MHRRLLQHIFQLAGPSAWFTARVLSVLVSSCISLLVFSHLCVAHEQLRKMTFVVQAGMRRGD